MPRRKPYTKVLKQNQLRADHVRGMGDVLFKGFQCLNPECQEYIFIRKDLLKEDVFEIKCPNCGFIHKTGEISKFYDYKLKNLKTKKTIEEGEFNILHDDYINEAKDYKYCIICNTLKPVELFDTHSSRLSLRQGECKLCKKIYNSIKNQTRITEQHREAAQKRRLYVDLAGDEKIDMDKVRVKFKGRCFKCGKKLGSDEERIDHTLPIFYLWPVNTDNATLLCKTHNGHKSGRWPSEYYSQAELKRLAVATGIDYSLLSGRPTVNPVAIKKLQKGSEVDKMLKKYAPYMDEMIRLRNRILLITGFDFFSVSKTLSSRWRKKADEAFSRMKKSR